MALSLRKAYHEEGDLRPDLKQADFKELDLIDNSSKCRLHYFFNCVMDQIWTFFEKTRLEDGTDTLMLPYQLSIKTNCHKWDEVKHHE